MDAALQASTSIPQASGSHPIVVKLGGSIVRGNRLEGWLDVLSEARHPVVVVPGGGALADEVRRCQHQLGFGDETAHRMALLAMDQLAWAIAGMRPGFKVGTQLDDLHAILARDHMAVWAPAALIANRADVEATWRLTSDSLALWLAGKLGSKTCCVLKSASVPPGPSSADRLTRDGLVDEAFPEMLAETGVETFLFGAGGEQELLAFLSRHARAPGAAVAPAQSSELG